MNYKIVEKESFNVVGKKRKITTVNGENFVLIPKFWNDCMNDGSYDWICANAGKSGTFGVCMELQDFDKGFTYMIAVEKTNKPLPKGFEQINIPASTWAVFESVGPLPQAIQDVTRRIFSEWLPSTGYQHACAPELEVYPAGDTSAPDYKCEVWIPINK